jgi:hypothetical protein
MARSGDPLGALLLGVAAAVLAGICLHGAVVRPRLAVNAEGVAIRTTRGTTRAPWPLVRTTLATTRRLGREAKTLEIEIRAEGAEEPDLIVLGWLELGADPDDVLDAVNRVRSC